ncbi:hypothetical protein GQ53DRAFT_670145 [Thozetella sp. PMI_491]|nr:hypothetical protein GQ53DRAFT_670145 [Thozetella sp. PMI_491]
MGPVAFDAVSGLPESSPSPGSFQVASAKSHAGVKRTASGEPKSSPDAVPAVTTTNDSDDELSPGPEDGDQMLSKRQLKRLRRQKAWEEAKGERKIRRKEKRHDRQARKRAEKELKAAEVKAAGDDIHKGHEAGGALAPAKPASRPVPVTFMIDCDFEQYMHDNELVSLSGQITRSYSENRKAQFRAHFVISSFGGKLKERFETVIGGNHLKWKGVRFADGNFVQAAVGAREEMHNIQRRDREMEGLEGEGEAPGLASGSDIPGMTEVSSADLTAEPNVQHRDIIYLSSESPYTLTTLEPNTIYVIGGLVDRNREKGLCYRRAQAHGIRTAKLPIGKYMAMSSRFVLTTNQVVEIMSNFLMEGDWGAAFVKTIPQRKGGTLKVTTQLGSADGDDGGGKDDSDGVVVRDDGDDQVDAALN